MKKILLVLLFFEVFSVKIKKIQDLGELSFPYAYHTPNMKPLYPKKGESYSHGLTNPVVAVNTFGTTPVGKWRLIPKGKYSGNVKDYPGYNSLEKVVKHVANGLGKKESELPIHELKDGEKHISYGVILFKNSDGGYLYFGDSLAAITGYAFSNTPLSGTVSKTAVADARNGFEESSPETVTKPVEASSASLDASSTPKVTKESSPCDGLVNELEKKLNALRDLVMKK